MSKHDKPPKPSPRNIPIFSPRFKTQTEKLASTLDTADDMIDEPLPEGKENDNVLIEQYKSSIMATSWTPLQGKIPKLKWCPMGNNCHRDGCHLIHSKEDEKGQNEKMALRKAKHELFLLRNQQRKEERLRKEALEEKERNEKKAKGTNAADKKKKKAKEADKVKDKVKEAGTPSPIGAPPGLDLGAKPKSKAKDANSKKTKADKVDSGDGGNPNFKTKECNFFNSANCLKGKDCPFIHTVEYGDSIIDACTFPCKQPTVGVAVGRNFYCKQPEFAIVPPTEDNNRAPPPHQTDDGNRAPPPRRVVSNTDGKYPSDRNRKRNVQEPEELGSIDKKRREIESIREDTKLTIRRELANLIHEAFTQE